MKNAIILIVVIALVGLGAWYWTTTRDQSSDAGMESGEMMESEGMMEDDAMMEGEPMEKLTEEEMMMEDESPEGPVFDISASNFEYDVKEIRVKKGDIVTINLTSAEGTHDWNVDEFNAGTVVIPDGGSDTIDFRADKTGTFEYYCSVGRHREMGMVGKLIVE